MAARTPTINCHVYYYERNRSRASLARTVGELDEVTGDDMREVIDKGSERRAGMGLADWFSTFCKNIQVQDGGTISSRYKTITRRLNTDFWDTGSETSHSLYVGSYGRNTAIQGFSDLDMIFQLPWSEYLRYNNYIWNGQSALLQAVRQSIGKTYPTTRVGADGQVVEIAFKGGITFEVVPAFEHTDGSFTFPDANDGGSWRTTNPRPEIEAIRSRNNNCHGNLVRLCRMMRAWKSKWNVPMADYSSTH